MYKNPTCPNCRVPYSNVDLLQLIVSAVPFNDIPTGRTMQLEEMELKYAISQSDQEEMAKKLELFSIEKE